MCFSVLSMARLAMMVQLPIYVSKRVLGTPNGMSAALLMPELAVRDAFTSCRLFNGSLRAYLGLLGVTAVTASVM